MTTSPVFTYYYWVNSVLTPLPVQTPSVPACAINEIAAVGVHITFLAGPQVRRRLRRDEPTTLDTIVYCGARRWRRPRPPQHVDARGLRKLRR